MGISLGVGDAARVGCGTNVGDAVGAGAAVSIETGGGTSVRANLTTAVWVVPISILAVRPVTP